VVFRAHLAAVLLDLFQSAEGQNGAALGLFLVHARGYIVLDSLLEMETQLGVHPLFREALVEQTTEPTHLEELLLYGSENQRDGLRQPLPIDHLCAKALSPRARKRIEFSLSPRFRFFPLGLQPSAVLQPV